MRGVWRLAIFFQKLVERARTARLSTRLSVRLCARLCARLSARLSARKSVLLLAFSAWPSARLSARTYCAAQCANPDGDLDLRLGLGFRRSNYETQKNPNLPEKKRADYQPEAPREEGTCLSTSQTRSALTINPKLPEKKGPVYQPPRQGRPYLSKTNFRRRRDPNKNNQDPKRAHCIRHTPQEVDG